MGAVILRPQANPSCPLIDEASILPGADMLSMVNPAREDEVVESASAAFEPGKDAPAGGFEELELNRPTGLLLDDDRS